MKLIGISIVLSLLVCTTVSLPSPLQGFKAGDQTTGSKWPPYKNAGKDYWSLRAEAIDLAEHNVDDGKDIVKKGADAERANDPRAEADEHKVAEGGKQPAQQPTQVNHMNRRARTLFNARQFFLRYPYVRYLAL